MNRGDSRQDERRDRSLVARISKGEDVMKKEQCQGLIREGMVVVSADGEKLGKVTRIHDLGFEIEKGLLFRTEREARYGDVMEVRGDDIFLGVTKDEIEMRGETTATKPFVGGTAQPAAGIKPPGPGEEARIPLVEEEVVAKKRVQEAGEVRVHKETVTEQKQVTVPVQREVVRVERVPASGTAPAAGAFQEESVTVPVRQEVVDIEKRPVVREEVVVTKETREGTETAATTARREEIDIEKSGDLKEREVPAEKEPFRKAG